MCKTWVWTYDNAGNILAKTEYAYTRADNPIGGTTVVYSYGNEGWDDLLAGYNGKTITSDTIATCCLTAPKSTFGRLSVF